MRIVAQPLDNYMSSGSPIGGGRVKSGISVEDSRTTTMRGAFGGAGKETGKLTGVDDLVSETASLVRVELSLA